MYWKYVYVYMWIFLVSFPIWLLEYGFQEKFLTFKKVLLN